jgi:hypothetical protein
MGAALVVVDGKRGYRTLTQPRRSRWGQFPYWHLSSTSPCDAYYVAKLAAVLAARKGVRGGLQHIAGHHEDWCDVAARTGSSGLHSLFERNPIQVSLSGEARPRPCREARPET